MKVLVAYPDTEVLPAGPAYIAAALKQAAHEVTGHAYRGNGAFEESLRGQDVLAVGGLATHFKAIRDMVQTARERGITTIAGGGIVSSEPELMTRAIGADYSVLGQGEVTVCELLQNLKKPEGVPGIAYVESDGTFRQTAPRPEIADQDVLPFPDYDVFGYAERLEAMRPSDGGIVWRSIFDEPRDYTLVASRGCPFHCTFCYHPSAERYRRRGLDSVFGELEQVVPRHRVNIITLLDELFSVDEQRVLEFCERFKAFQKKIPWRVVWACSLHVSFVNSRMLEAMRDSGCYYIAYGLESYHPDVLRSMNKRTTPAQIRFAIQETLRTGMVAGGNFIIGDKAETFETADVTFGFWREALAMGAGISVWPLVVCPNSPDYQLALKRGLIKDRVRHITRDLFKPLNMTALSNAQYDRLMARLCFRSVQNTVQVSPVSYARNELTCVCPFCHTTTTYRNYNLPVLYTRRLVCRNCGRCYVVIRRWVRWMRRAIVAVAPEYGWTFRLFRWLRDLVQR